MNVTTWLVVRLQERLPRARCDGERGASAIEWVIITAVLVALAAAVGWFIWNMVQDQMGGTNLPDLPGGGGGGGGGT